MQPVNHIGSGPLDFLYCFFRVEQSSLRLFYPGMAKPFIFILFGPGYITSVPPLQILAWMLIPYTVNSFLSLAFLAEGDVTIIMIALMATIITLAILTIWLDPLMNIKGAAWAALFSETLQSIILSGCYFKQHGKVIIGRPVET